MDDDRVDFSSLDVKRNPSRFRQMVEAVVKGGGPAVPHVAAAREIRTRWAVRMGFAAFATAAVVALALVASRKLFGPGEVPPVPASQACTPARAGGASVAQAHDPGVTASREATWAEATPAPANASAEASPDKVQVEAVRGGTAHTLPPSIDALGFNAALDGAKAPLMRCFGVKTESVEKAIGDFFVKLTLGPDGRVDEASLDPVYSVQNPFIGACAVDVLSQLAFPPTKDGKDAHTLVPFNATFVGEGAARHLAVGIPLMSSEPIKDDASRCVRVATEGTPSKGAADAPIQLVEYIDYECPFSVKAQATLAQLLEAYPGQIRLFVKHHPLPFHPHARLAARAALAAGEQGKFWEYHALLFANTNALDEASLDRFAEQAHLDLDRFHEALRSDRTDALVVANIAETERNAMKGTPSFLINGRTLLGARPLDIFKTEIEAALSKGKNAPGTWCEPATQAPTADAVPLEGSAQKRPEPPPPPTDAPSDPNLQKRIADHRQDPEREPLLRRFVDGLISGRPNLDDLSPGLANLVKDGASTYGKDFQGTTLKSLVFKTVDPDGSDVYIATFQNQTTIEFRIYPLTPDHKIGGLFMEIQR